MSDLNIRGLGGPQGLGKEFEVRKNAARDPNAPGFDDVLKGFLKDVNEMQVSADKSIQKMVAGEVKDVHQVMLAVGEAKVAFNLMLEIRNKTMEAYQELMRMRG
jgi:flagellar hook-basal body complex protein FliE